LASEYEQSECLGDALQYFVIAVNCLGWADFYWVSVLDTAEDCPTFVIAVSGEISNALVFSVSVLIFGGIDPVGDFPRQFAITATHRSDIKMVFSKGSNSGNSIQRCPGLVVLNIDEPHIGWNRKREQAAIISLGLRD